MTRRVPRVRAAVLAGLVLGAGPAGAECPPALEKATQVLLVTAPDMGSLQATLRRFERPRPGDAWREVAAASPAVVGATGLGWADPAGAPADEPQKHEGDKRTPAGFFPLGRPFGRAASTLPGYLKLEPGQQICVDAVSSPSYGRIVSRHEEPKAHGEDMGTISLYRRGFVIDTPVDAARRSGSCIFLHVWRAPTKGTVGCVALPEPAVAELQAWVRPGAAIAILPRRAAEPVLACLTRP